MAGDLAGLGYLITALLVTVDVVARRLGFSLRGTVELSGYLYALGLTWGLAHTFLTRGHVRVDFLLARFSLQARAYLHALAVGLLACFSLMLAWRAWALVRESAELSARDTSALSTPLVVPQALWAAGLLLFALATVAMTLRIARLLARREHGAIDRLVGPPSIEAEVQAALEDSRPRRR